MSWINLISKNIQMRDHSYQSSKKTPIIKIQKEDTEEQVNSETEGETWETENE